MKQVASLYLLTNICLSVCFLSHSVTAQISSDGTLSTTVSTDDTVNFLIENGDISGSNLFHSFLEFSIPNLGSAYFNNATDITNIFSRVTGGNISDIQGLIRANGTANLFLINPAGIVFGENASLDVGGSFFASTAESVVFGDGMEFSAVEPQEAPLLTINITPGLQMGANPGNITVQGNGHQSFLNPVTGEADVSNRPLGLSLLTGQSLVLVGGDILLQGGNITTVPGIIELGSVGANENVNFTINESGLTLNYDGVETFQDINLSQSSSIVATGGSQSQIRIQGRNLTLTDGSVISISTNSASNVSGGNITIHTSESVEVLGATPSLNSSIGATLAVGGQGNGGSISLETGLLRLTDGGVVNTATGSEGNAGNVNIRAEQIEVSGLNPYSPFPAAIGTISLPLGTGNAGDINIQADSILVRNGGAISSATFGQQGNAGDVTINADSIELRDFAQQGNLANTGIFSSISGGGTGDGGDIDITTGSLRIADGLQISASSNGLGVSGNINIKADVIDLTGSSPLSLTDTVFLNVQPSSIVAVGFGINSNAGSITIDADEVNLEDGAVIGVSSLFLGNAGDLRINAPQISLDNSQIQANTNAGSQGNIILDSSNLILRNSSSITTNAGNFSNGGNITIDTSNLVALENSDITANAVFGQGGNIIITAQGLFLSIDSEITASSEFGIDGVVEINTPDEENKLAIAELPADLTDASQQIVGNCSWTRDNTFYVVGRRGIAKTPQEHIQDYTMWSDIRDFNQAGGSRQEAGGKCKKRLLKLMHG